jgi:hypothetical protein
MNPLASAAIACGKRFRLRHLELLIALVTMMVVESFTAHATTFDRFLFATLLFAIVLAAVRSSSRSRRRLFSMLVIGALTTVSAVALEWHPSSRSYAMLCVGYLAFFVLLLVSLGENVFGDGVVDVDRILGAVCIFFVMGLTWAFAYALLELLQPGAFRLSDGASYNANHLGPVDELIYFSHVTLTTLGYGDVVPVTKPARTLATLEAMTGQLYLAIVIARLVGMHAADSRSRNAAKADESDTRREPTTS